MRALLFRRSEPIAPFGEIVDNCPLGASTFGAARAATLRALRLTEVELRDDLEVEGPALVLADDVWVTTRALRGFLAASATRTTPCRLALPDSETQRILGPLQDSDEDAGRRAFDVAYVPAGTRARPSALFSLDATHWVEPPFREIILEAPAPRYILGSASSTVKAPVTSTVAMRIRHWVHLLRASHLATVVCLIEAAMARPVTSSIFLAQSLRFSKASTLTALRRHAVYCGRGVRIHP